MRLNICVLAMLAGTAQAEVAFVPIDLPEHIYDGGWTHFVGGGLAVFDCDGDHLPELFAAGGTNPGTLFRNRSVKGGDLAFDAQTPPDLRITGLTGAYPIDIDSDGYSDLVLLSERQNRILKGGADCTFTAFDGLGLDGLGFDDPNRWTTAFSAAWIGTDALPTLAFGNYVDRDDAKGPFEACDVNHLYRPSGQIYGAAIRLDPGFCALSMLFSDWSRTGRPDLRISNDRHYYVKGGAEQLWTLAPDLRLLTEEDGWIPHELWGMGIASRDVSGDGWPEVYLSSMGDQRLQVLAGNGRPEWTDVPFAWGTTAHRPHVGEDGRPSTGWHTAFGDVQNDGLDDIFVSKGNVEQMPGLAMQDPNSLLIATGPQRWEEAAGSAGLASFHRGRGAALTDLNMDGRLDLAVVNRRAPLEVWQNASPVSGHFVTLRLRQADANRDAVGAWIEIDIAGRIIAREVTIGGGHAGGSLGPEHVGLGDTSVTPKVRVIWPDGTTSAWQDISVNAHHLLHRSGQTLDITTY